MRVLSLRRAGAWRWVPAVVFMSLLSGCTTLGYYAQAISGQWQLLRARQPITVLLSDPDTAPVLRERLQRVELARDWASRSLQLPDNGSYRSYAELHRPYVVWNVFATEEFSLAPQQHCFPVAGCVAYQGYYDEADARARAQVLSSRGYDVHVAGVAAYSTLGWFDDPLLSTMLRWDDATLLYTLFHELAHQKLYVKGDTGFNESFAEFVGEEGLRQFAAMQPQLSLVPDTQRRDREEQFTRLVLACRAQLQALYRQPLTAAVMRERKAAIFASLRQDYTQMRDRDWGGEPLYERWFNAAPLNNARLLPFGLYQQNVPAFAQLFDEQGRDWSRFYAAAQTLAALTPARREAGLAALAARAAGRVTNP